MMTTTDTTAPPRGRRRGTYAKTEATRQAILDAALEVFAQSGYRAGSLRDIAARVGMSEAGLLHHFRNKSALLEAVLEERDERARVQVPIESDDGAAVIRGLVDLAAHNASSPGVVELYTTLSAEATASDHPAHGYFVRRYEYTRGNVERSFGQLRDEGRLRHGMTPRRAAITAIALMDGLQVQWLLDRDALDMAVELRALFASFVDIDWPDAPRESGDAGDRTAS
ncbi:TetR/AcrR family transcriptional regulator [Microbacterium sp. cf332]|uniref:TetR/AcrR family transcriptional regulator n=1 Tax=Microbacterium sp. cf332 TaxID=1761804 RepID=UPI000886987A|nr:TetR family transcriptional regulator [Microbacterium sp. cf332]SDQ30954.1 transcriptional regulator, TetR family [Microbacterium sp. cf332]